MTRWLSFAALKETMDQPTALEDGMALIRADLDGLLKTGISLQMGAFEKVTFRLAVTGIKGDWPFLIAAANLDRHFRRAPKHGVVGGGALSHGVCHLCLAGMPGFAFDDYSVSASWEQTMYTAASQCPWTMVSSWAMFPSLPHFQPFSFRPDLFHGWHLGAGRYFVASCLVVLMSFEEAPNGQTGVDARLAAMTQRWIQYCKDRKDS